MGPKAPALSSYSNDEGIVAAIRGGDEAAFLALVEAYHTGFVRLARLWCSDTALAEDVVQETWVTALEQLDRFAGRSTLKTWLCGILHNHARNRLRKEQRTVPLSVTEDEPAVDRSRFSPHGHRWDGHWATPPTPWRLTPEQALYSRELGNILEAAIAELPAAQREVLVFRDVEGLTGEETCAVLGVSENNQRVLLHRARSKLRNRLELTLKEGKP
jgi:RNA polymerase sigma-70 factor (ECF subfamily)